MELLHDDACSVGTTAKLRMVPWVRPIVTTPIQIVCFFEGNVWKLQGLGTVCFDTADPDLVFSTDVM